MKRMSKRSRYPITGEENATTNLLRSSLQPGCFKRVFPKFPLLDTDLVFNNLYSLHHCFGDRLVQLLVFTFGQQGTQQNIGNLVEKRFQVVFRKILN